MPADSTTPPGEVVSPDRKVTIPAAVAFDASLSNEHLRVYLALAAFEQAHGECMSLEHFQGLGWGDARPAIACLTARNLVRTLHHAGSSTYQAVTW